MMYTVKKFHIVLFYGNAKITVEHSNFGIMRALQDAQQSYPGARVIEIKELNVRLERGKHGIEK